MGAVGEQGHDGGTAGDDCAVDSRPRRRTGRPPLAATGDSSLLRGGVAWLATSTRLRPQPGQSTATSRAPQISRIRVSANRPSRSTRTATETLSTESRLTAERRGTGS